MRLGVVLPRTTPDESPLTGDALVEGARRIERLGFDSAWSFDSIGRGFMIPDPLIAVSVAASVTQRIEVGTCILQVPLRRPVELAHRILTAHLVCRGRLLLGVGAGSTKADFDAVGVPFETRLRDMDESLAIMRKLWAGEQAGAANLKPWPAALGGPKVLIGSWRGETWIPRAAKEFDGWIASGARSNFTAIREGVARYRAAGGARAIVTNLAIDLDAPTTSIPDEEPFHMRCGPDAAKERLQRLVDLGFDDAVLVPHVHTDAALAKLRALVR
jgi:alkanesulfonate monooxygenase SsuD/methylene tetrahydromethanopterin reductase-like flavin-dependent oxidoreductase (luciferase family)